MDVIYTKSGGGTATFPNVESYGFSGSREQFLTEPFIGLYHQSGATPTPYVISGFKQSTPITMSTLFRSYGTLDVVSGTAVFINLNQEQQFDMSGTLWYRYTVTFLVGVS